MLEDKHQSNSLFQRNSRGQKSDKGLHLEHPVHHEEFSRLSIAQAIARGLSPEDAREQYETHPVLEMTREREADKRPGKWNEAAHDAFAKAKLYATSKGKMGMHDALEHIEAGGPGTRVHPTHVDSAELNRVVTAIEHLNKG